MNGNQICQGHLFSSSGSSFKNLKWTETGLVGTLGESCGKVDSDYGGYAD